MATVASTDVLPTPPGGAATSLANNKYDQTRTIHAMPYAYARIAFIASADLTVRTRIGATSDGTFYTLATDTLGSTTLTTSTPVYAAFLQYEFENTTGS